MLDKESNDGSGNRDNTNREDSAGNGVGTSSAVVGGMQDGPATAPIEGSQDVESDPALNDEVGHDWTDEGGATPAGPATS